MHLPTLRARRACTPQQPVDYPRHPRNEALAWLHGKLAAGDLGLDPYDATVVCINTTANERVWARAAVELTGILAHQGSTRVRCFLEADARMALGLDQAGAPLMHDEPLASRGVDPVSAAQRALDRPALALVDPEPEAMAALHRAKAVYDRKNLGRQVH